VGQFILYRESGRFPYGFVLTIQACFYMPLTAYRLRFILLFVRPVGRKKKTIMAPETYEKIISAAQRLFVQQGYTATSMRQVAEAAGIGKATIYHHFPDKQAILMALLHRRTSRMEVALQLVRAETDPRRRIQVAAEASVEFLLESADILQIVRREIPGGREQMQEGVAAFFKEYMALLADAVRRGIEQGIFRPVDPTDAARVLMTMIQGTFAMAYVINERAKTSQQAAAALLDVYFQGLDAR
jgi:AcrR family transcriptional regulator